MRLSACDLILCRCSPVTSFHKSCLVVVSRHDWYLSPSVSQILPFLLRMAPSVFNRSSSVSLSSLEDFCHHEQDASDSVAPPSPIAASFVFSQSSDCSTATENSELLDFDLAPQPCSSFLAFRLNYILVNLVVMLADGLQGTHLLKMRTVSKKFLSLV